MVDPDLRLLLDKIELDYAASFGKALGLADGHYRVLLCVVDGRLAACDSVERDEQNVANPDVFDPCDLPDFNWLVVYFLFL